MSNFQGNGAARTATLCRVLVCAWPQVHDGRYWVVWWLESRVDVSSLGFPATNDRLCGDGIPPSRRQVVCGGPRLGSSLRLMPTPAEVGEPPSRRNTTLTPSRPHALTPSRCRSMRCRASLTHKATLTTPSLAAAHPSWQSRQLSQAGWRCYNKNEKGNPGSGTDG